MKSNRFLFSSLALCAAAASMTLFTACDKNNDPDDPSKALSEQVQGSYTGDMTCTVMNSPSTYEGMVYEVSTNGNSAVDITLPGFGEGAMKMPDITVTGVVLKEKGDVTELAPTQVQGTSETGKTYQCTLAGSVAGDELTLSYNIQYGAMPMPLICTVTAHK